jgi:hypothetical protein
VNRKALEEDVVQKTTTTISKEERKTRLNGIKLENGGLSAVEKQF